MEHPPFDFQKVIRNRPWFERAIETVAPAYALKRLEARVQRELFSYNAALTDRIYAPRQYGQPSESTQTTRSRVVMMWEARDLVENFGPAKVALLKYAENWNYHQIAEHLGISHSAVETRLFRSRQRLREELSRMAEPLDKSQGLRIVS